MRLPRRGCADPPGDSHTGQRATYDVLHRAGLAAEQLRAGLDKTSARKAIRHLHALVDGLALGIADSQRLLAWAGPAEHHRDQLAAAAHKTATSGHTAILRPRDLPCDEVDRPVRGAVVAPLTGADPASASVGALVAVAHGVPAPGLVQATLETARFVSTQLPNGGPTPASSASTGRTWCSSASSPNCD